MVLPGSAALLEQLVCGSLFSFSPPPPTPPLLQSSTRLHISRPMFPRQPVSSSQLHGCSQHSATQLHTVTSRQRTTLSEQSLLVTPSLLYPPTTPSLSCAFHGCRLHMLWSLEEEECLTPPQLLNLFTSFIRQSARHSGQTALSACDGA